MIVDGEAWLQHELRALRDVVRKVLGVVVARILVESVATVAVERDGCEQLRVESAPRILPRHNMQARAGSGANKQSSKQGPLAVLWQLLTENSFSELGGMGLATACWNHERVCGAPLHTIVPPARTIVAGTL